MRKSRLGAIAATGVLASATVLGGAGAANASEELIGSVDVFGSLVEEEVGDTGPIPGDQASVTGGAATVTATAYDNCTINFAFNDDLDEGLAENTNWVVDYRIDGEDPTIQDSDERDPDVYDVFRPVVGSNAGTVDALNENYGNYDVGLLTHTVNLNALEDVERNEDGEHTVTFKFYRGSADWESDENQGEITVTGCDTPEQNGEDPEDDDLIGSLVQSVDVFGSLEGGS